MKTHSLISRQNAIKAGFCGALFCVALMPLGLSAQEKKTFTHAVDIRPTHEDALLDVFKSISDQFGNEQRAVGTAYTTAEILYHQGRYDDAARNFLTVINKGHKYPYLANSARLRLADS